MNPVFGKQLQRAREIRGISVEEAAHATRMRTSMIEALEAGDLAAFPNPAYAKSFLLLYGKYLRLDVKAVAAEIDTGLQVTVDDYQYLAHANETTKGPARRGDFARPHSLPSWTPVLAFGGITAVVVFGFLLWLNMSRIGDVTAEPPPKAKSESEAIEPVVAGAQPVKVTVPDQKRRPVAPAPAPAPEPTPAVAVAPPAPTPEPAPVVPETPAPVVAGGPKAPAPLYPKEPPPPPVAAELPVSPAPAPVKPAIIGAAAVTPHEPVTQIDGVEVRPAKVISPAARLAAADAALLAQVDSTAPQTPPPLTGRTPVEEPDAVEQDQSALAKDPNTVEIESGKKTWIAIHSGTGALLYEDYLYPSARPMRLPAGKYRIEIRDAEGVEIRRAGRTIAYTVGGIVLE